MGTPVAVSRQFRALGRIGAVFGAAWSVIGTLVSFFAGGPLLPSLLTFGVMFGLVGGISGIATALIVARAESGRSVEQMRTWRVALAGFIGGSAPITVISLLGLLDGTSPGAVQILVWLGIISGGVGALIAASAASAAKRIAGSDSTDQPKLPAT